MTGSVLRAGLWLGAAALLYILSGAAFLPQTLALRLVGPGDTALMRLRHEQGTELQPRSWTPLRATPPFLAEAVLAAEDDRFAKHAGFSLPPLRDRARRILRERTLGGGASTISQQLAKNVWLSPARNPLRKLKEAGLTLAFEAFLDKPRILELYLNSIEWGRGVFGVGAASRTYFGKAPARLSRGEAALLAGAIRDPLRQNPANPSARLRRRQAVLLSRIRWDLAPDEWTAARSR